MEFLSTRLKLVFKVKKFFLLKYKFFGHIKNFLMFLYNKKKIILEQTLLIGFRKF